MPVCGYMGSRPGFRTIPAVESPVVSLDLSGTVRLPDDTVITWAAFDELIERGDATEIQPYEDFKPDHVLYFPEGDGPVEYLSLAEAAHKIKEFADEKGRLGDALFAQGRKLSALKFYEVAAAAAQGPSDYEKMLLCPMPEKRRRRIEKLRDQSRG